MPFTEETYGIKSQVPSSNLNDMNGRLKNQWWSLDLTRFDHVAGPAPTTTNGIMTLPGGSQVQFYLEQFEQTQITKVRYRHADGATPTGQLQVGVANATTIGATSVVTVMPLQASTTFAQSTNFVSDDDSFTAQLGSEDKSTFISMANIGVESVRIHKVMVFFD